MANLTLSTAVKDKVATLLFNSTYSALGSGWQKDLIDGEGASALIQLQMLGQYFTLAGGTAVASGGSAAATDSFEPLFVSLIKLRCSQSAQPERCPEYRRHYKEDLAAFVGSFNRQNTDYSPGTSAESFVYSVLAIRNYVLSHTVRLKDPLIPDIQSVDAAADEVLKMVWNRSGWRFRRRPAVMTITRTAFTGGTWSESAKTITCASTFTVNAGAGQRVYITGGTGTTSVNQTDYPVTSNTATVLSLVGSIGATDGATDIAGFLVTVSFSGIENGETFDSIASVKGYYFDAGHEAETLTWLDADEFARARALDGSTSRRPWYFRNHAIGATNAWQFCPPPDASYSVRCEILVSEPGAPTGAGNTSATSAPYSAFSAKFLQTIRRATLSQVLTNYGRTNTVLADAVADEIEERFPVYQDAGSPEQRGGTTDVYHDIDHMHGFGRNQLGGAL